MSARIAALLAALLAAAACSCPPCPDGCGQMADVVDPVDLRGPDDAGTRPLDAPSVPDAEALPDGGPDAQPTDVPLPDGAADTQADVFPVDLATDALPDGTDALPDLEEELVPEPDAVDLVEAELPPPMEVDFPPVPEEDKAKGLNSNAYLAALEHPTAEEQVSFVAQLQPAAIASAQAYGVPACAIGGMGIVESGYGFTRTGWNASNLFGLKYWNQTDPSGAASGIETYQLRGQPDEAWDGSVKVLDDLGPDRKIFKEPPRYDNRYHLFEDYDACVEYLVVDRFLGEVLLPFVLQYQERLAAGWTVKKAARQFLFEIAAPRWPGEVFDDQGNDEYYLVTHKDEYGNTVYGGGGYCHLGGTIYRKKIGAAMDQWNLYEWDAW
jgi:hypothetical protein